MRRWRFHWSVRKRFFHRGGEQILGQQVVQCLLQLGLSLLHPRQEGGEILVQFLLLLHGQIGRVLQKGKGGGGAKLFHALGQTEGLPGRVQDGTALGAQIGETLEPIFPLGKGLLQDT